VRLVDKGLEASRRLIWKWKVGNIQLAELGNPTVSTSYALCIYSDDVLVKSLTIPPGGLCSNVSCWKALKGRGFRYRHRSGNAEGVRKLLLRSGEADARIVFKAKGAGLTVPLPISQGAVLNVQLVKNQGDGGECWGSVFEPPARTNKDEQFSDTIP